MQRRWLATFVIVGLSTAVTARAQDPQAPAGQQPTEQQQVEPGDRPQGAPQDQAPVQPQSKDTLDGVYECQGVGPNGDMYHGIVEIGKNDHTYRLQWRLAGDDTVYLGLGIVKGDTLAVSYFGETVGVVLYRIEDGPKLIGEWTVVGADGEVYSETLTKVAAAVSPAAPSAPAPTHRHRSSARTREVVYHPQPGR
jgi:hypothetical protein